MFKFIDASYVSNVKYEVSTFQHNFVRIKEIKLKPLTQLENSVVYFSLILCFKDVIFIKNATLVRKFTLVTCWYTLYKRDQNVVKMNKNNTNQKYCDFYCVLFGLR